ncbi:hypothetical protein SAMN04488028_102100 [Reichenbachiella agariperforans]|uniref:SpoIIAA-like n=1 Tax=Reichenbachiella agariperforans TaxID=156994 RepID=A0A1M6N4S1_REIAG|nr:STAS/SEC14 domain-containing protein [Reichenbachiella agariperforans]SHJ90715.1 hypothetical protein SAMN04488028_102100 [Reichenbachiella agariperforans]
MSVEIISYKDISIIYTNLSGLAKEEGFEVLQEAVDVISQYPPKSVYSLINVEGIKINSAFIDEIKRVGKSNAPYVKGTAAVGLTSMTKLIARTMIKFTGRKAELFDTVEDAKEWLYLVHMGEK